MTPEQIARVSIDTLLRQAGWHVCSMADANIHAARGVALRGPQLSLNEMQAIALPIAPASEQRRIDAEVNRRTSLIRSSVESEIDANPKRVKTLRQATVSKAFVGNKPS